jgi:glycine/D-amino acid oxidase-like deaminating enzyme
MYDYLIIGQGIAGTTLSYQLLKKGKKVLLVDEKRTDSSSRVAAGLFNPITGRRMIKTWLADNLFPYLHTFYPTLEKELGARFFFPLPVYRPFSTLAIQNHWASQTQNQADKSNKIDFEVLFPPETPFKEIVKDELGGILMKKGGGYVDLTTFLDAYRNWLDAKENLLDEVFDFDNLKIEANHIEYTSQNQRIKAKKIIFCRGFMDAKNPYFDWLPYLLVKGEILTLKFNQNPKPFEALISRSCWIVSNENNLYKTGSTYEHKDLTTKVTQEAKDSMCQRLEKLLQTTDYQVVNQEAGIRPSTLDQRPFIGLHPKFPQLGIFNGLGTKGTSLAPYLADTFCEYLENKGELIAESDILRYWNN